MKVGLAITYTIWAVLVLFNWVVSTPESAPQQAALAGQALVLSFIPYAIVSVFQRSGIVVSAPKPVAPVKDDVPPPNS
jgi:hypothetical protein